MLEVAGAPKAADRKPALPCAAASDGRIRLSKAWRRIFVRAHRAVRRLARDLRPRSPRTLVKVLGAIVAVTTALSVPFGFGVIGYVKEADGLAHRAELVALQAAQHIYAFESPWRYDTGGLGALGETRLPGGSPIYQRILDTSGHPLAWKGTDPAWPTLARSAPIFAAGVRVGTIEISASLRPLISEVAALAILSLLLGGAAYFAFAVLPLKVVDRSLGELEIANAKFRRQNLMLDAALENMAQGLAMFDADECVVIANDRFAEMFGLAPADVQPGTNLRDIVCKRIAAGLYVGTSADDYINVVRSLIATGRVSQITNKLADGRVLVASIHPRADGGWVATHQDITEHQRLTARLAEQNELLQQREAELRAQKLRVDAALENMAQGLAMFDENERIVLANDRFAEMYGLTREQVKPGTTLRRIAELRIANGLYAGLTADDVVNTMRERVGRGRMSHLTSKLGDGRTFTVSIRPTTGGGWVTTHQDITERENLHAQLARQNELLQQREEELKSQNLRFNAALSSMSQGLAMFDADQRVVIANDRYAELYGLTPEQVKPGTTLRAILEARTATGLYNQMDARKFVEDGLAGFTQEVSQVVRLADGRFISVLRRPMADGGLVSTHEDVTERERLNEHLDVALNNMAHGLALYDDKQRLLVCNDLYAEMYGLTPEQVKPGTTVREILECRAAKGTYRAPDPQEYVAAQVDKFGKIESEIHELADGRIINVAYRRTGKGGHVITHQDITERQALLARLEQNNRLLSERTSRLQTIVDNFPGGIAFLDSDLRIVLCNEKTKKLLDLPESLFAGREPLFEDIVRFSARRGDFGPGNENEQVAARMALVKDGRSHILERPDGTSLEFCGVPLEDGGYVTTLVDVTERRRSEAKIEYMALHDALTGLANRVLLSERLEQSLARVRRGEMVAVHLLDLDHFKNVNDTMGHPAGDKLLRDVSGRLRLLVRETDTIARMGGDEFAVLQAISQPADATALARRVIESISEPYEIDGRQIVIGTSLGIAVGPTDGVSPDELMRNADLALYRAKDDGRGTFRFFETGMDAAMQERRELECDLRKALAAGEFELHYQPVFNIQTNLITAVEALLRWRHPVRGMLPPSAFIALAEETGFIVPLGEWVIREACATAAGWPDHTRISVNLSPVQFRSPGLVRVVVGALAATGLSSDRLELEITESALLEDSGATLTALYSLRELGVRVAVDDFGTGYSSLSYLQSFPFDRIKIDRSFIKDIAEGLGSRSIVRAVAALGKGLGMETTAEGVETREQLDSVQVEGCTEVQGYFFSEPRPAHEIGQLFLSQAAGGKRPDDGKASAA